MAETEQKKTGLLYKLRQIRQSIKQTPKQKMEKMKEARTKTNRLNKEQEMLKRKRMFGHEMV